MENTITELLNKNYNNINDEELKSHIFRYICVLVSGYLETELNKVIDNYKNCEHFNNHECKNTINSQRKIQNAKWCSIRPFFANIDDNFISQLKDKLNDFDEIVGSIDTIVRTRHKIAHGENNIPVLSKDNLERYFSNIKIFLEKIQECINELES